MSVEESQLYRDLMRLRPECWTPNAWAVAAGVSRTVWTDMRRHGNPSRRTLEKLLTAAGSSLAEFEALRVGNAPGNIPLSRGIGVRDARASNWRAPLTPPLPLIASGTAGSWGAPDDQIEQIELRRGEIVDGLPRPPSLAGDSGAYALTIVGDSMWPRFSPGNRIAVSPQARVAIGDDVVLSLAQDKATGWALALIKKLVGRTANCIELRQFNPDRVFQVDGTKVASIEKVMGELF